MKTSKPPLILLHGALGSSKQFDALLPYLRDKYEVYSFNFYGHGGLDINETFSIKHFAVQTKEFIENLALENVNIFGYSMGGYVAVKLASQGGDNISHIVTLGTKWDWSPEVTRRELNKLNPLVIEEKLPKFASMLAKVHYPSDWKDLIVATARMMQKLCDEEQLSTEEFSNVKTNLTIAVGDNDNMVSIEETENVMHNFAHAKLKVLAQVEHAIEKVDTQILANYIIESLQ